MGGSAVRISEQVIGGLIIAAVTGGIIGTDAWLPLVFAFLIGVFATYAVTGWRRQAGTATTTSRGNRLLQRSRSISGAQLIEMVSGQISSDRVNTVRAVAHQIHPPLTGREACQIVQHTLSSDRVEIIEAIAPSIKGPLSPGDLHCLLSGLLGDDRTQANLALANKVK